MPSAVDFLAWIGNRIGKPLGWERVVRLFAPPESCRAMPEFSMVRDGIVFRARPGVPLGWHVAFFGTYEPELREIFRAVLEQGAVAVDVGANVGWHTLLMAHLVGQGGRVLAFEPNPSVRGALEDNLAANRFGHVQVLPYALSDAQGAVNFHGPRADDPGSGDGHVLPDGAKHGEANIRVETHTLDEVFASVGAGRLDLVKIDVEGFEWPALRGAEHTIAKFRPHVVFEYNAEYAARGGGTPELLDAYFARHRYLLFVIGRNWAEAMQAGHWPGCADVWAVPQA